MDDSLFIFCQQHARQLTLMSDGNSPAQNSKLYSQCCRSDKRFTVCMFIDLKQLLVNTVQSILKVNATLFTSDAV